MSPFPCKGLCSYMNIHQKVCNVVLFHSDSRHRSLALQLMSRSHFWAYPGFFVCHNGLNLDFFHLINSWSRLFIEKGAEFRETHNTGVSHVNTRGYKKAALGWEYCTMQSEKIDLAVLNSVSQGWCFFVFFSFLLVICTRRISSTGTWNPTVSLKRALQIFSWKQSDTKCFLMEQFSSKMKNSQDEHNPNVAQWSLTDSEGFRH